MKVSLTGFKIPVDNLKIFETTDPSGNVITFRELPE